MVYVPDIPNPNSPKGIQILDLNGGQAYISPVEIGPNNLILTPGISLEGMELTTAGVTDTTDKRFVTDDQLATLTDLTDDDLGEYAAVLAAIGALTGAETKLATVAGVDLNSDDLQALYTVPTGKSAVITRLVFRNPSTSLTTASWSVGFASTAYTDVIANATHTELTGATLYSILGAKVGARRGAATEVLNLKNNTKQGGAATVTVDVFGYLY